MWIQRTVLALVIMFAATVSTQIIGSLGNSDQAVAMNTAATTALNA